MAEFDQDPASDLADSYKPSWDSGRDPSPHGEPSLNWDQIRKWLLKNKIDPEVIEKLLKNPGKASPEPMFPGDKAGKGDDDVGPQPSEEFESEGNPFAKKSIQYPNTHYEGLTSEPTPLFPGDRAGK